MINSIRLSIISCMWLACVTVHASEQQLSKLFGFFSFSFFKTTEKDKEYPFKTKEYVEINLSSASTPSYFIAIHLYSRALDGQFGLNFLTNDAKSIIRKQRLEGSAEKEAIHLATLHSIKSAIYNELIGAVQTIVDTIPANQKIRKSFNKKSELDAPEYGIYKTFYNLYVNLITLNFKSLPTLTYIRDLKNDQIILQGAYIPNLSIDSKTIENINVYIKLIPNKNQLSITLDTYGILDKKRSVILDKSDDLLCYQELLHFFKTESFLRLEDFNNAKTQRLYNLFTQLISFYAQQKNSMLYEKRQPVPLIKNETLWQRFTSPAAWSDWAQEQVAKFKFRGLKLGNFSYLYSRYLGQRPQTE